MSENLDEYLSTARELQETVSEFRMVSKLIDKAQTQLSVETLSQLQPYMSTLLQKLGELQARKIRLEQKIQKIKPRFIKIIDNAKEYIKQLKGLFNTAASGEMSLGDLWSIIQGSKSRVPRLLENLKKSLQKIEALEQRYQDELRDYLHSIASDAKNLIRILEIITKVAAIDPTAVIKYKRLLGQIARLEPGGESVLVTDIYMNIDGQIYLEVSVEEEINQNTLEALYKDIGFDFMATDISDFRAKFIRRMRSRINRSDLTPSAIKQFLSIEGLINYLSSDTLNKLQPKYRILGYVRVDKIAERGGELIIERGALEERFRGLIRCPSIKMLPEHVIGNIVRMGDYNYQILAQTFMPRFGRVLICIRQDKNGEPTPHIKLIERIFLYLAKRKDLSQDALNHISKAIKLIKTRRNLDEIYWRLRIMIARSGISSDITESTALRPINVFLFCLKNSIPLLLSEIYTYYLYVIETDNINVRGYDIKPRFTTDPHPFFSTFDPTSFKLLMGLECGEYLGVLYEKNRIILLCSQEPNKELIDKIKSEYKLPPEFPTSIVKLLKGLILLNKIKSLSEYYGVLDMLRISRIIYTEIVKEFDENDELVVAHTFLMNLTTELIK